MTVTRLAAEFVTERTYRLENLFGISSVNVRQLKEQMPGQADGWQTLNLNIPTNDPTEKVTFTVLVRARLSDYERCPRCYLYTRAAEEPICPRCANVLHN